MKYIWIAGVLFFSCLAYSLPDLSKINCDDITVISSREMKNCFITIVKIKGEKYLIKQKKDMHKPLSAVKEALSAYIAKVLNIAHTVEIVPPHVDFPGKIIPYWPATIHSFIEGVSAHKYGKLRLKQYWKVFMEYKDRGLTRDIIRDMARDWRLAVIVAVDTIAGNTDRHGNNLIYNPKTHCFWAIDMDDTFNKDLCAFNYGKLKFILKELNNPFTYEELEGLRIYRDTLKKLLQEHTPESIQKKLRYFVKQAGIVPGSPLYDENISSTIHYYEQMIVKSWKSAHKLVAALDKIVLIRS